MEYRNEAIFKKGEARHAPGYVHLHPVAAGNVDHSHRIL